MSSLLSRREALSLPFAAPFILRGAARKMNVLMVAVDDLNNRIGCYGEPVVQTPNIDRLARRGVRFDHAHCQYPLCNPTRTSLLSGLRPDVTRIFDNNTPPRTYLKNHVFMPEYFKQQGYFTARVGKIAHGTYEHQIAWDISESRAGVPIAAERKLTDADQMFERKKQRAAIGAGKGKEKKQDTSNQGGIKLEWQAVDVKDSELPDGATALRIVDILEKSKDKQFFVGCGFHKPHLTWIAPKKYFDLYDPMKVIMPNTPADDRDDIPPIALTRTKGDEEMTELDKRKAVAAYHAATSYMDAQLGLVLDAMDHLKLWENTVVLLFGDHGWHLNDHLGLWRKMTVFEEAARAPLVVAAPGKKAGVGCPRLVEFVDIFPSFTELCGVPAPGWLEGTSFVPLLGDPQRPWKKAAYTQVIRPGGVMGRSVRTERYRYTEWGNEKVAEFYDHEFDSHEWTNLARKGDARSAKALAEAKQLLHGGWRTALPPKV